MNFTYKESISPLKLVKRPVNMAGKKKRANLPKSAVDIMYAYVNEHVKWAYPSDNEKRTMAAKGNITKLQVDNWFINARRRVVPKLLAAKGEDPNEYLAKRHRRSSGCSGPTTSRESSQSPENTLAMYIDHDYTDGGPMTCSPEKVNTITCINFAQNTYPISALDGETSSSPSGSSTSSFFNENYPQYESEMQYEHNYNSPKRPVHYVEQPPPQVINNFDMNGLDMLAEAATHVEMVSEMVEDRKTYQEL